MCGIIGFVSGETAPVSDLGQIFSSLLLFDQVRGWDSTGAFVLNSDWEGVTYKRGFDASTFISSDNYGNLIFSNLAAAYVAIGHNRSATKGSISDRNAHPFTHNHITVAHNGNISNYDMLVHGRKFDVDSMVVPHVLADKGEVAGLESMRGAFALAWYNEQDRTLNLARNGERPMTYTFVKGKNIMVFASEAEMIYLALSRLKLQAEGYKNTQPGTIYKFCAHDPADDGKGPALIPFQLAPTIAQRQKRRDGGQDTCGTQQAQEHTGTTSGTATTGTSNREPSMNRYLRLLAELPANVKERQCWASGPKRIAKAWAKLKNLHLTLGTSFVVRMEGFHNYGKGQKNGKITGFLGTQGGLPMEIPNVTQEEYLNLQKRAVVWARIVNAKSSEDHKSTIVIVAPDKEFPDTSTRGSATSTSTYVPGPGGKLVHIGEYLALTAKGCNLCGKVLCGKDAPDIAWVRGSPICKSCFDDPSKLASIGASSVDSRSYN